MAYTKRSFNPYQIAGKSVTAALRQPGAAQNGKVPTWNDATKKWEPGDGGGGGGSGWQGGWDWDANADALPAWTPGQYGYGIGERLNAGDDGYLPGNILIFKKGVGNAFADFEFR